MWIETTCGCVHSRYVVRIERDADGSVLHLTNGQTVKSSVLFDVIDRQLAVVEAIDDDDDSSIPF
jgi:hypothetical protein